MHATQWIFIKRKTDVKTANYDFFFLFTNIKLIFFYFIACIFLREFQLVQCINRIKSGLNLSTISRAVNQLKVHFNFYLWCWTSFTGNLKVWWWSWDKNPCAREQDNVQSNHCIWSLISLQRETRSDGNAFERWNYIWNDKIWKTDGWMHPPSPKKKPCSMWWLH